VMEFAIDAVPGAQDNISSTVPVPEWALVLCAEFTSSQAEGDWHWNFVTLKGPTPIGYHPVSGTRQFGLKNVQGQRLFYVRAADRVTTIFEVIAEATMGAVFAGGEAYWNGFFANVAAFINQNGGDAQTKFVDSRRHPWSEVRPYLSITTTM
jgi:hypothetical protein